MSNNESFIDEVNDEVRRDRFYGFLRRYGWIGVVLVLVIVGGTAWQQISAARSERAAEARGDALLAALGNDAAEARAEALSAIGDPGPAAAVIGFHTAAAQVEAGEVPAAVATLEGVAADDGVDALYRDLAQLKALMIDETMTPAERAEALATLARPGAPFRLVAMEQQALALIEAGETEAAIADLRVLVEDAEVTQGLRERASALIVSLGGTLESGAAAAAAAAAEIE